MLPPPREQAYQQAQRDDALLTAWGSEGSGAEAGRAGEDPGHSGAEGSAGPRAAGPPPAPEHEHRPLTAQQDPPSDRGALVAAEGLRLRVTRMYKEKVGSGQIIPVKGQHEG